MTFEIDDSSAPIEDHDLFWLEHVEPAIAFGAALGNWWEGKTGTLSDTYDLDHDRLADVLASDFHPEAFLLTRRASTWPRDLSYGFRDVAVVNGQEIPVLGRFQQMFFDQPRLFLGGGDVESFGISRENLRAFVLEHFLSTGRFETSIAEQPDEGRPLAAFLKPFSLLATPKSKGMAGLDVSQLYYRRADSPRIGKFWPPQQPGLDLGGLAERYRWVVADFQFMRARLRFNPAGRRMPYVTLPISSSTLGVVWHEGIIDDSPAESWRGRYGLSYALLGDSWTRQPLGGFGKIVFRHDSDGSIVVQQTYVSYHPGWLMARVPDPLLFGLDFGNRLTRGLLSPWLRPSRYLVELLPFQNSVGLLILLMDILAAASGDVTRQYLGLSEEQLEKRFLANDAISFMRTLESVAHLWRSVADWRDDPAGRHRAS